MNDDLDRRLRSWAPPPVRQAFAERMARLFARLIGNAVHVGPLRPPDASPEVANTRAAEDRLEYVTRVRLDGYVPVRDPRIVVERRSR